MFNDKLGINIAETVYEYSSFVQVKMDIFKYIMNHPIFNGYMKMYNKFWVQGFAIKNKILGPVVPTHTTNIKGQYWIMITENSMNMPLPGLDKTTNGVNQSINQVLQVISQNPSTKQGIVGSGATYYGKKAYGKPKLQTTWNTVKRNIGSSSTGTSLET